MSLYGALFSGVSGLNAQGTALSVISDNIANLNTVGYKGGSTSFETLLTAAPTHTSYSSGGVQASDQQLITVQGTIQNTGVSTDLAISGNGFFVVNSNDSGTGAVAYTRAGAFTQNQDGDYVNSAGYTLMAWPLDSQGRLPGAPGNLNTTSNALLSSLQPVNVNALSGTAQATTNVSVAINLNSSQATLQGSGETISIPQTAVNNANIASTQVLTPDNISNSGLFEGNSLTLSTGALTNFSYTYTYGGVANTGASPLFGAATATVPFDTADGITDGDNFTITTPTLGTVTYTFESASPTTTSGQFNSLSTLADAINNTNGLTARIVNNQLFISPTNAQEGMTFADGTQGTLISNGLGGNLAAGTATTTANRFSTLANLETLINNSKGVGATIDSPLSDSTMSIYATDPLDTLQFTGSSAIALPDNPFTSSTPTGSNIVTVTDPGNSLQSGDSIYLNNTTSFDGVTVTPGVYTVTVVNAGDTFTIQASGGSVAGNVVGGGPDVTAVMPYNPSTQLAVPAFTTDGTSNVVTVQTLNANNLVVGSQVSFNPPTSVGGITVSGSYQVNSVGPNNTFTILASSPSTSAATGGPANPGDGISQIIMDTGNNLLTELGLSTHTPANLKPAYDPTGQSAPNMSSGGVTADFSRNVQVYDALGTGHNLQLNYIKLGDNTWGVEVTSIPPTDISSTRTDGLVAYGTITFNGDGSLRSVSPSLTNPLNIVWTNGASPSKITFNFGTAGEEANTPGATSIGETNGMEQFDSAYNVTAVTPNGVSSGLLTSLTVDTSGFVSANFSNGQSRQVYQIPLATFINPDGLTAEDGDVYQSSEESGEFNLEIPDSGNAGSIESSSLEQSNVELSDELTNMIIAQRGYQACSQVVKTADQLLSNLIQTFGNA